MLKQAITFFIITASITGNAQTSLPISVNIAAAIKKQTRTTNGTPGKNYWQNTASYDLKINFDPATRLLKGEANIEYTNNSPDSLRQMVWKLYPNLYKKTSIRMMTISEADMTDGVVIESMAMEGANLSSRRINGTNMNIALPKPLLPKQTTHFTVAWHYTLNKGSHTRTGEIDPGADFVAYFFPRIAVYDDIDGWNNYPYLGTQEFYNDFCHFKAAITVPSNEVVWSTGNLLNGKDVLSEKAYNNLQRAEKNDAYLYIIDSTDLAQKNFTKHDNETNTWLYEADNVTDLVFACSDHYLWQSTSLVVDPASGRRTRVDAAYNPKHKPYYTVIEEARKTVEYMSYRFPKWPYPYPHETVFDGLDQMEYPMMVNDNPVSDKAESIELTDHEIFHTMFPFYMGINETKYAWMDEGWATIGEWQLSPMIDTTLTDVYGVGAVSSFSGREADLPVITLSTETNQSYFVNSYPKPAMGYLFVKDMLGDALFTKALHTYINNWKGKHPIPQDFFNSMNAGSGKNLNWFWKAWFMNDGVPDLAIGKVTSGKNPTVEILAKGTKPVPVDLTIYFADSTTRSIHRNIAVWEKGNASIVLPLPAGKKIVKMMLGSAHVPDGNKEDNERIFFTQSR
jgi:hypothetical protein